MQDFVVPLPPQTAVLVLALAEIQEHGVHILLSARVVRPTEFFTCKLSGLAILSKQKTVGEYNLLLQADATLVSILLGQGVELLGNTIKS